jgi:hypothetical protein
MMKTIRINGVEQTLGSQGNSFDEFMKEINQSVSKERQVISSIRINGREISEADEAKMKTTPLDQLGDIEIATSNPVELAIETLSTLDQYTDRIVASINRAALHYKTKNLLTGDSYFAKAIDALDLFVQTIGGIKLALRVGLNQKLALAEATLVSTMNDLLDAKRQNNYVYLAELLESDLTENLNSWKQEIFPMLRSWPVNS